MKQIEWGERINSNLLPSSYFLATKLEAIKDRGIHELYESHVYKDIIYLLDNIMAIVDEILASEHDLKQFKKQELSVFKNHPQAEEILALHIHPLIREERF